MDSSIFRSIMNDLCNLETSFGQLEEMYLKTDKCEEAANMSVCRENALMIVNLVYATRTHLTPK